MSNVVGNVLINEDNTDIFPRRKGFEGLFDLTEFRVGLDNEKVGSLGSPVSDTRKKESSDGVLLQDGSSSNSDGNGIVLGRWSMRCVCVCVRSVVNDKANPGGFHLVVLASK